jgi:hypothetical protein
VIVGAIFQRLLCKRSSSSSSTYMPIACSKSPDMPIDSSSSCACNRNFHNSAAVKKHNSTAVPKARGRGGRGRHLQAAALGHELPGLGTQ